jgi:hypothetical protein
MSRKDMQPPPQPSKIPKPSISLQAQWAGLKSSAKKEERRTLAANNVPTAGSAEEAIAAQRAKGDRPTAVIQQHNGYQLLTSASFSSGPKRSHEVICFLEEEDEKADQSEVTTPQVAKRLHRIDLYDDEEDDFDANDDYHHDK